MTFQRFMYDKTIHPVDDGFIVRIRYGSESMDQLFYTLSDAQTEYQRWPLAAGEYCLEETQLAEELFACR